MIGSNLEHPFSAWLCHQRPHIVHRHHGSGISEPHPWFMLLYLLLSGMLHSEFRDAPPVGAPSHPGPTIPWRFRSQPSPLHLPLGLRWPIHYFSALVGRSPKSSQAPFVADSWILPWASSGLSSLRSCSSTCWDESGVLVLVVLLSVAGTAPEVISMTSHACWQNSFWLSFIPPILLTDSMEMSRQWSKELKNSDDKLPGTWVRGLLPLEPLQIHHLLPFQLLVVPFEAGNRLLPHSSISGTTAVGLPIACSFTFSESSLFAEPRYVVVLPGFLCFSFASVQPHFCCWLLG